MKATIKTKFGTVKIYDTQDPCASHYKKNSILYKSVAAYFDYFINNIASDDTIDMYFGSFEELYGHSYCSASAAIEQGIDAVIEHIEENNIRYMTTKQYYKIDLEGVFEA